MRPAFSILRAPVKAVGQVVGLVILLSCASITLAQDGVDEDFHPTDGQLKELEQSCAVSDPGMLALEEKVSAAVTDWRKATAGAAPGSAMRQLDGFFDQVRNHGSLSGRKSIYVLCVEKALRQFVEVRREKPLAVVGVGSSQSLRRLSFGSEDEIWRRGCQQAESDAMSKLQLRCGDRTFVQTNSDCAQGAGEVRTYTAQVSGECRAR